MAATVALGSVSDPHVYVIPAVALELGGATNASAIAGDLAIAILTTGRCVADRVRARSPRFGGAPQATPVRRIRDRGVEGRHRLGFPRPGRWRSPA
jgi:hypothetical protein